MPVSLSGSLLLTGSLTTTGQIVAQTLNVQQVTSSIVYSSGSNTFGNDVSNVQAFTGSLRVTGSGDHYIIGGNVGIGTASPDYDLDVESTTEADIRLNSALNQDSNLRFAEAGTNKWVLYNDASADSFKIYDSTALADRVILDSSGNLGLGVTPSAWLSTNRAIQLGYGAVRSFTNSANTYLENNNFVNSTGTDIYLNNGAAGRYRIIDEQHIWYQAPSGTAGNTISFTQAMTLDASGNLGIGTTSPTLKLHVAGGYALFNNNGSGDANSGLRIQSAVATTHYNWKIGVQDTVGSAIDFTPSTAVGGTTFTTPVMVLLQSGNVGIGTTNPATQLHVSGSSAYLRVERPGNDTIIESKANAGAYFLANSATDGYFGLELQQSGTGKWWLGSYGITSFVIGRGARSSYSDYFHITTAGNVGINTTSPNPNYKFNVVGNSYLVGASSTSSDYALVVQNSSTSNLFLVRNDGLGYISGSLGIGTTSVNSKLHVFSSAGQDGIRIDATTYPELVYLRGGTIKGYVSIAGNAGGYGTGTLADSLILRAESGYIHLLNAGNSPTLTVNGSNVGIGTTGPSTKLHLYETGNSDVIFRMTAAATGTEYDPVIQLTGQGNDITGEGLEIWYDNSVGDVHISTTYVDDAASIRFHTRTGASKSTSNERLTILGGGNVGIGTTNPTFKLDVSGAGSVARLVSSVSYTDLAFTNTISTGYIEYIGNDFHFFAGGGGAGDIVMTIDGDNDRVGIGTTNPAQKLHVSGGYVRADGYSINDGTTISGFVGYEKSWTGGSLSDLAIAAETGNNIRFYTNGLTNVRMFISSSGNVGIGTASPTAKLDVSGGDAKINEVTVGRGAGNIATNTALGSGSLAANTTGCCNTAVGNRALLANTTGWGNTAVGSSALVTSAGGLFNTAVGVGVLKCNTTGYRNTAVGAYTLYKNSTGCSNIAFGGYTLKCNTSGCYNSAFGYASMTSNTTGCRNTAVGFATLVLNTTGHANVAIGSQALCKSNFGSTSATANVAVGYRALCANTLGTCNTAIGTRALQANTTGLRNVAIGTRAMELNTYGFGNIAIGTYALRVNTTNSGNTAVGNLSMQNNVARDNTAVGIYTLFNNTIGLYNAALGAFSLCCNTTGCRNTAVGTSALRSNISGCNNTAVGHSAMGNNSSGIMNTAIGKDALNQNRTGNSNVAVGTYALSNLIFGSTSATANVAVGYRALYANSTGTCHTAVGTRAQETLNAAVNNTITVGIVAATSATTGHTVWGNSGNNVCNCVYAAWTNVSDLRDKTNIKSLDSKFGLALINKLRPVSFNWDHRDTYVRECSYEYGQKDGTLASEKEHYGLVAQELKATLDELGIRFDALGHDDEKQAYRLAYEELIPAIIKSIQELSDRVDALESK